MLLCTDWTLGAVMYENAQYDCWTMPSAAATVEPRRHLSFIAASFIVATLSSLYTPALSLLYSSP